MNLRITPDNGNAPVAAAAVEKAMAEAAANQNAAADAESRKKAQDDVARRVAALQAQASPNPAAAPAGAPAPTEAATKEGKLADLLRRYQADEITPLEYHTERAKIVAEP